jgi:hypothetical protein
VPIVLQPVGREFSAGLGPGFDTESSELGKEPLHAYPQASLTQLAMKAYSILAQPQRQNGEMDRHRVDRDQDTSRRSSTGRTLWWWYDGARNRSADMTGSGAAVTPVFRYNPD